MAKIQFKRIMFRNFMSYGANNNTFVFMDGVTWCCGSNGFGKSTIVEAINFALFGDSYRGTNKPDLINTMNPGCELEVELEFKVAQHDRFTGDETWIDYRVIRTMKAGTNGKTSGKFDLYKLEDNKWIVQNKRAGFSQDDFEDNILGFNEVLFKSVIALNTQEAQPFMELPVQKRRDITESIIDLHTGPWKKANGKRRDEATMQFNLATSEYGRLGQEITNLEGILEQMKAERQSSIEDLKAEINRIFGIIEQNKVDAQKELAPIDGINAQIAGCNDRIVACNTEITARNAKISEITANKQKLASELADENALRQRVAVLDEGRKAVNMKAGYETALSDAQKALAPVEEEYRNFGKDGYTAELQTLTQQKLTVDAETRKIEQANAKIQTEVTFIDRDIANLTKQATDLKAKSDAIVPGVPCPTCGKPSTDADVAKMKGEIAKQVDALRDQCRTKLAEKREKTTAFNTGLEKIKANNETVAQIDAKTTEINAKLAEINDFERVVLGPARTTAQNAKKALDGCLATISRMGIEVDAVGIELASIDAAFARNTEIRNEGARLNGEIAEINTEISQFNTTISNIRSEIATYNSQINDAKSRYNAALSKNEVHETRITEIRNEIAKLEQSGSADSIGRTEARLAQAREDQVKAHNRMQEASDTKAICTFIDKLCSDEGMKRMVFDIFIPMFNKAIAANLARTNLPVSIVFDSTMDYTYEAGPGLAPTYKGLSQGQQRKVGFAIAMAFRDFVSRVGHFSVNFVSFDEVIDQSTDNNAMREMLEMIRGMVDKIGCAFIISHRGEVVRDLFDYRLEVKNNGAYSRLGELEKL